MTEEEIREHTRDMILQHATDIEWLTIHESLVDKDLTNFEEETEEIATQIYAFIQKAVITVTFPGEESA